MKFLGGSALSDEALSSLAHEMVATHGEQARDVVNAMIDDTNAAGDFAGHATWMNVGFGVLQILRPDPRWEQR